MTYAFHKPAQTNTQDCLGRVYGSQMEVIKPSTRAWSFETKNT